VTGSWTSWLRSEATLVGLLLGLWAAGCGGHAASPEVAVSGTSFAAVSVVPAAGAPLKCAKVASPGGNDNGPGTARAPYRTVATLLRRLRPGQVGCLSAGTFKEDVTVSRGGAPGRPITLTSAPAGHATIQGLLWITRTASDVVISRLTLDGSTTRGAPSPQVNGNRVVFRSDGVTNSHTGICFVLGGDFPHYGAAHGSVIEDSRIHDCGRLPRTGHDQGIYVEGSRGARIINNAIYRNADWGVQLYPDAQMTYVAHNVIAGNGNGVIIAGGSESEGSTVHASSGNVVERNVIADSTVGPNVESNWDGRIGTGNIVRANCLWNGAATQDSGGMSLQGNINADPRFLDLAGGNFRLQAASPCRQLGAGLSG
jgi:parallel beta-helix repeat protein